MQTKIFGKHVPQPAMRDVHCPKGLNLAEDNMRTVKDHYLEEL